MRAVRTTLLWPAIGVLLVAVVFFIAFGYVYISGCVAIKCLTGVNEYNEQSFVDRGMQQISSGDYENAERVLAKVLAYNPDNFVALTQLAGQLRHRGEYAESEALFLRAAAVRPEDAFLYVDIGKLYRNMHEPEKALAMFAVAERLDPKQPRLWSYGYAELFATMQEYDKAIAANLKAIKLDPSDHYTYMSLGNIYRDQKRYDEAIAAYLRSIEVNPRSEAYFGLGYTYLMQHKLDDAQEWFLRYIEMFPAPRGEVYSGLGFIAEERGDLFKAILYHNYAHFLDASSFKADAADRAVRRLQESSALRGVQALVFSYVTRHAAFMFNTLGIRS